MPSYPHRGPVRAIPQSCLPSPPPSIHFISAGIHLFHLLPSFCPLEHRRFVHAISHIRDSSAFWSGHGCCLTAASAWLLRHGSFAAAASLPPSWLLSLSSRLLRPGCLPAVPRHGSFTHIKQPPAKWLFLTGCRSRLRSHPHHGCCLSVCPHHHHYRQSLHSHRPRQSLHSHHHRQPVRSRHRPTGSPKANLTTHKSDLHPPLQHPHLQRLPRAPGVCHDLLSTLNPTPPRSTSKHR